MENNNQFVVLLKMLDNDPYLSEKISSASSIEEAFELVHPYLPTVTFDDFKTGISIVMEKMDHEDKTLSDEFLESVSGGIGFREVVDYFGNVRKVSTLAFAALLSIGATNSEIPVQAESQIENISQQPIMQENNYQYAKIDNGVAIIGYTGSNGIFAPPNSIGGMDVVQIGIGRPIINNQAIKELNLENINHPYKIDDNAFHDCKNLKVTSNLSKCISIGKGAFWSCFALEGQLDLSNCVHVNDFAFTYCFALIGSISLSKCKRVGKNAFSNCIGLTAIENISQCEIIDDHAFENCNGLYENISLPECEKIGNHAFEKCSGLKGSISLPKCKTIGNWAFENCINLTDVVGLNNCVTIGDSAFNNCYNLTSVLDLKSCKTIGIHAFENCENLKDVINLSNCNTIGVYAFNNCKSIKTAPDLSNCDSIGNWAFNGCINLEGKPKLLKKFQERILIIFDVSPKLITDSDDIYV